MKLQNRRIRVLALIFLLVMVLWGATLSIGASLQQLSPTEQQQTIDALVQQRFQETAQALQQIAATQTINAAFNQALTATAAFQLTLDASFNRAMTATAAPLFTKQAATGQALEQTSIALNTQDAATAQAITTAESYQATVAAQEDLHRILTGNLAPLNYGNVGQAAILLRITGLNNPALSDNGYGLVYGRFDTPSQDGYISFIDLQTGYRNDITPINSRPLSIILSPDASLVSAYSEDQVLRVYRTADTQQSPVMMIPQINLESMAFSPDNAYLAATVCNGAGRGSCGVTVWSVRDSKSVVTLRPPSGLDFEGVIKFSPDGSLLAIGACERDSYLSTCWQAYSEIVEVPSWGVRTTVKQGNRHMGSYPIAFAFNPAIPQISTFDLPYFQAALTYWYGSTAISPDGFLRAVTSENGLDMSRNAGYGGYFASITGVHGSQIVFRSDSKAILVADSNGVQIVGIYRGDSTPLPTPTLSPSPFHVTAGALPANCILHTIDKGEYISSIAEAYGIGMDNLLAVNGLDEGSATFLQIGDVLIVPLEGCSLIEQVQATKEAAITTNTPAPTGQLSTSPTVNPTATVPSTATNAQVEIVRVLSPGDINAEGVEVRNNGAVVDLTGWKLSNNSGDSYTFPQQRLFTGSVLTVYTRVGTDTPTVKFWGWDTSLFYSGTIIVLTGAAGNVQSTYVVP